MKQRAFTTGRAAGRSWKETPTAILVFAAVFVGGCRCSEETDAPEPAASAAPDPGCKGGRSEDPPLADVRGAAVLIDDDKHAEAKARLDELIRKFPKSSTLRVWRGDAALFDTTVEYQTAARDARSFYSKAAKLQAVGCKLDEVDEYYLELHWALADLRLDDGSAAIDRLERAAKRWPDSAEVRYHLARGRCLARDLDGCYREFAHALALAHSLKRPRFQRVHNAIDDWIVRSETQSEFGNLRKDQRYSALVRAYRDRGGPP